MIVQIEKEATLLNKKADALVLVVDHDGADRTGLLKHWLDIGQVDDYEKAQEIYKIHFSK